MAERRYKGTGLPPEGDARARFPYLASKGLVNAVNMAIELKKPLLVQGPPGCGKTRLARAVAVELGLYPHRYYEWFVKSTSRARDGLYTIDMVRRLHDARLDDSKAQGLKNYVRFGVLGEAIKLGEECVVLIDEIDKADIDFPNDLLREIEEKKFTIEELADTPKEELGDFRKEYSTDNPPVVIITSNNEKELPEAFLRRCLFFYIDFPEKEPLVDIVRLNTSDLKRRKGARGRLDDLIERAADRLIDLRDIEGLRKEPATSELIDWVRILHDWGVEPDLLKAGVPMTSLPFWEMLFKHQDDVLAVRQHVAEANSGAEEV